MQDTETAMERILSAVQEDLSDMTLVENKPEFALAARIHGWKPVPAARITRLAEKKSGCPVCDGDSHQQSVVWHAYGVGKNLAAALEAGREAGLDVDAAQIKRHFMAHSFVQPAPAKRLSQGEMIDMVEQLKDREKQMLLAVYRQRVLKSAQLADLFFAPSTKDDVAAQKSCLRTLHKLRYSHLLYQYNTEKRRSPERYYFLGRYASPWIENQEGRLVGQAHVTDASTISEYHLEHDINASDVFVQMRKQLYTNRDRTNLIPVRGQPQSLHLPIDTWWSARSLQFGFVNPFTGLEQRLIPDGFAALTINDGRHHQYRLPFFYEWDSGWKSIEETVEQLENYVAFATSGALGLRFPKLAVEGYFPPVVVVTNSPNRAYRLAQLTREACERHADELVPQMFVTDAESMRSNAWVPGAWHQVHGDAPQPPVSLAEMLLDANGVLVERAPVHWRMGLEIDLDGAKPKPAGAPSTAGATPAPAPAPDPRFTP